MTITDSLNVVRVGGLRVAARVNSGDFQVYFRWCLAALKLCAQKVKQIFVLRHIQLGLKKKNYFQKQHANKLIRKGSQLHFNIFGVF